MTTEQGRIKKNEGRGDTIIRAAHAAYANPAVCIDELIIRVPAKGYAYSNVLYPTDDLQQLGVSFIFSQTK